MSGGRRGDAPPAANGRTGKPPLARRLWARARSAAEPFFFAARGAQSDDHLVEVVRRDPAAASQLIRSVALFSAIGNTVVGLSCALFLSRYWGRCGECDRPLRWWLLLQSLLQMSQLPVRIVMLFSVRSAEETGASIEACVMSLTASPAWRASKTVALLQYGWFVLGMVWWMHTETCPGCPGISRLTAAVMALSAARAAAALAIFRLLFAAPEGGANGEAAPKVVAATPGQIAALPCERYSSAPGRHRRARGGAAEEEEEDAGASCSICLSEYSEGSIIRRLPCGHDFHRRCVDKWLQRNKRCPLCIHAVDEPCPRPAHHAKAE